MSRDYLLTAKVQELTASLQEWTRSNLNPGEQLVVSLHIQDVQVVSFVLNNEAIKRNEILDIQVLDFFTLERLGSYNFGFGVAKRTHNCLVNDIAYYNYDHMTLGQFLEKFYDTDLLRTPNFGRTCLNLIKQVLKAENLMLKHR